ncbi:hypothetical protein RhiirA4_477469 [Rhizophagus irregularis]|uniref:Uncharacterized protein n=1 Tax=Rhizophagus irregularis TaxID=588596 RepID=A0A2I1HDA7_9GLOM|nr:hypothetical protein RhiirA4_477469 [Rhizophagus irregularis]
MGLFTGFDELLTQDPVAYWRFITDIKNFFSLLGLSRFTMLQTSFHAVDWALSFDTFQQSIYLRLLRFPGLYADDSLCPNCGIFMETLEHLFICLPSSLDVSDSNPEPLQHKDITVELIQRFIIKLATKISYSPACKRTYEELLSALHSLNSIGLPSLLSDSGDSSFSASWFLQGFIPRDLPTFLMRYSGLKYRSVFSIISRTFLKLQREIYHGLWRLRCKIKVQQDLAKGLRQLPSSLRTYNTMSTPKAPSVINSDIPPPPRPDTSAPSGDRPLSPNNDAGVPNKCSRTVSEDAMNIDTTSSSAPASNLISSVPSGLPVNKVQVVSSLQTTTTPVETVDASIYAPSNAKGKDKAVEFSNPARAPSPDASKASIQSSSSRFHAAAYLRDAPDAFKTKFTTNRAICDEVDHAFSKLSSYGSRARCEGSGDDKRILVSFFTQADLTSSTSQPCTDLLDLVFVPYFPADMKRNVEAKSLFVTDIPLFYTSNDQK